MSLLGNIIFSWADGVSCVCKAAYERNRFLKYRKKMLPYVYNRIPNYGSLDKTTIRQQMRNELGISPQMIVGVYVGRITKEKGLAYLADALKSVPSNCIIIVVGSGDYLEEMKGLAGDKVMFVGEQREIYRYLFAGDFFLQPSLHENHSIALLEAAAAGLPIIATDVGGNKEIVRNQVSGILIPPGDDWALSHAICNFCNDAELLDRFRSNISRMEYREFQDDAVDQSLHKVYQEILRSDY